MSNEAGEREKLGATAEADARGSDPVRTKTAAQLVMERETRVRFGPVPRSILDEPVGETQWQMSRDRFLLRATGDHYFYYEKGNGTTVERGSGADISAESLWLNGSVYSAVASLNGLLPIHASAVAVNGSVVAFTGVSGAGKSTLVAALAATGFPMFCDDTLVLDPGHPERIMCLPGHKRLKLTSDAIALTGAAREEPVAAGVGKFYARPLQGQAAEALPLGELIFLEEGGEPAVTPIRGAERFAMLQDDHYTAVLFANAHAFDRKGQFVHYAGMASRISMAKFTRPKHTDRFSESLEVIAAYLANKKGN
jgi:hypothetical protein